MRCNWVDVVSRVSIDVPATQDIAFQFVEQVSIGWRSPRVDKVQKNEGEHRVWGHLALFIRETVRSTMCG